MAGYYKYSMSNNAKESYENNEMPKSKWTKFNILNVLAAELFENADEKCEILSRLDVPTLKNFCLNCSSWHHTSKFYNETDFYTVNVDKIEDYTVEGLKAEVEKKIEYKKEEQIKNRILKNADNLVFDNYYIAKSVYLGDSVIVPCSIVENFVVYKKNNNVFAKTLEDDVFNTMEEAKCKLDKLLSDFVIEETKAQIDSFIPITTAGATWVNKQLNGASKIYFENGSKKGGFEFSNSGYVYENGKKPTPSNYEKGLENFFCETDCRLVFKNDIWTLERWNGNTFVTVD